MCYVRANIAGDKDVHGVIVAKSIDDKLKYAVTQVNNMTLIEYEINFNIDSVSFN